MQAPPTPPSVLAFDPGLRHLAVVHVARSDAVPPPGVLCREPSETTEEYRARGLLWFLHFGWRVVEDHWDVLDVTDALGREEGVANVKGIMDATKAVALADTLEALQARWFPGPAVEAEAGPDPAAAAPPAPLPSRIVVEAQHNANAIMRGVAMGILVNFRRSMPRDVSLTMLSGSRKRASARPSACIAGTAWPISMMLPPPKSSWRRPKRRKRPGPRLPGLQPELLQDGPQDGPPAGQAHASRRTSSN